MWYGEVELSIKEASQMVNVKQITPSPEISIRMRTGKKTL